MSSENNLGIMDIFFNIESASEGDMSLFYVASFHFFQLVSFFFLKGLETGILAARLNSRVSICLAIRPSTPNEERRRGEGQRKEIYYVA
jgi:hypothetical protein